MRRLRVLGSQMRRRCVQLLALALIALLSVACTDLEDLEDVEADYPDGPYGFQPGQVVPSLAFDGVDGSGAPQRVSLESAYRPQASDLAKRELLMVVVTGGQWCGTCRWISAAREPWGTEAEGRIRRLDVVLGDRDNAPATAATAAKWWKDHVANDAIDSSVGVVADPEHHFRAAFGDEFRSLPYVILIDRSDMLVVDVLANPPASKLARRVNQALAVEDASEANEADNAPLIDGRFYPQEWELLQKTTPVGAPPAAPSNRVADSMSAAALGRDLFFDTGLSPSGTIACASCHQPDQQLSDGRPRAKGITEGSRRTPSVTLAAHSRWQFWDGRADSLWSQALAPFEDEREMGSSRAFVARRILSHHATRYREVFGGSGIGDASAWPESGKPGESSYDQLPAATQDAITEVFVNAGKAIAAWERTLRVEHNPLDAYLAGDRDALDPEQKYGLQLFVRNGCMQCHWGPRLTDDAFHRVGFEDHVDAPNDPGRLRGIAEWRQSDFRLDGRWSDMEAEPMVSTPRTAVASPELLRGAFRTPSLRGVADAAFFGHAGQFADLGAVMEHYGAVGAKEERTNASSAEPWLAPFGETAQWGITPFLKILTAKRRRND